MIELLTRLIKKDVTFHFEKDCQKAFKDLKERLTTAPILTFFNLEKKAILKIDASDKAINIYLT